MPANRRTGFTNTTNYNNTNTNTNANVNTATSGGGYQLSDGGGTPYTPSNQNANYFAGSGKSADPRNFGQTSSGTQTGSSTDINRQNSFANSAFGNSTFGQQFTNSLTDEQQQQLQQLFSQTFGSSVGTSNQQTSGQTTVNDPFGFLALLQKEQALADEDTLAGTQALARLVQGENPISIDREQYIRNQNIGIQNAVRQATQGPTALGVGETDTGRLGASAGAQAALPFSQALLDADLQAQINQKAVEAQGAEILSKGSASTQLFSNALAPLTELFGTTTQGTQQGQTSEQTSQTVNQSISDVLSRLSQTQSTVQTMGEELGWSQEQIDAISETVSNSIAKSTGSLYGYGAESGGGGKYICTVCVDYGFIDEKLLEEELRIVRSFPELHKRARLGYEKIGPCIAQLLMKHKWLAWLVAPLAKAYMEYVTYTKRNWWTRFVFKRVIKICESFVKTKELETLVGERIYNV